MAEIKSYNHAYYLENRDRILAKNYRYEKKRLAEDPEYRERKREQTRTAQRRRRLKHRQIKHEALDRPCQDCGIRLPPEIMDFDHVRGQKLFNISRSYNNKDGYVSYAALHAEIAKCDVRCPNCHRLRHFKERLNDPDDERNEDANDLR